MLGRKIIEKNGTEIYQREGHSSMEKRVTVITALILVVMTIIGVVLNLPSAIALTQNDVDNIFETSTEVELGNTKNTVDISWIGNLSGKSKTISLSTFKESNNMFCMNEELRYFSNNPFEKGYLFIVKDGLIYEYDATNDSYEEVTNTNKKYATAVDITKPEIYNQIAYILYLSQDSKRDNIEDYSYQQVIWDLLNGKNSKNGRSSSTRFILEAAEEYVESGDINIDACFYILENTNQGIKTWNATMDDDGNADSIILKQGTNYYFQQNKWSNIISINTYNNYAYYSTSFIIPSSYYTQEYTGSDILVNEIFTKGYYIDKNNNDKVYEYAANFITDKDKTFFNNNNNYREVILNKIIYGNTSNSVNVYKWNLNSFDDTNEYLEAPSQKILQNVLIGKAKEVEVEVEEDGTIPELRLILSKVEKDIGTQLSGSKFDIGWWYNGKRTFEKSVTDIDISGLSATIIPTKTELEAAGNKIWLQLIEREAPEGYKDNRVGQIIQICFEYNSGSWRICSNGFVGGSTGEGRYEELVGKEEFNYNDYVKIDKRNETDFKIYIENEPVPELNLKIKKVDSNNTNTILQGAKIRICWWHTNEYEARDIEELNVGEDTYTIQPVTTNKSVWVQISEVAAPSGYKIINGVIKICYEYNEASNSWKRVSATGENNLDKIVLENNDMVIKVKNERELITLSGFVWLDEQRGLKLVQPPNGYYDYSADGNDDNDEKRMSGINVYLYDLDQNKIVRNTKTDNKGSYTFTNIPKNQKGYKVYFEYDGINYIVTDANVGDGAAPYNGLNSERIDSDVEDIGREEFNSKFHTIENGFAYKSNRTERIALSYNYSDTKAELIYDGKYQAIIAATTASYKETTTNIDMGLVRKGVDLSAYTSLDKAEVTINGEKFTYIGEQNIDKILDNEDPTYNLYLYNSDYNYRISDYKALTEKVLTEEEKAEFGNGANELDVILTYSIILNNESVTEASINKIAYYYDSKLELIGYDNIAKEDVTLNGKDYKKIVLVIEGVEFKSGTNQFINSLKFKVNKNPSGNINLGENKNFVEILSYSADDGCIDCDSEPGNMEAHPNEDDSDDAKVINVQIRDKDERKISGFVFEDLKSDDNQFGNGYFEENTEEKNKKVNDVIVQLIEIKDVTIGETSGRLEYIWQETVSGSNRVKYVTTDGKNISTYPVVNSDGEYQFKEFIPGNYIVRFIYGDGTYYDKAIDGTSTTDLAKANILKYNGQNYKSAIDLGYNEIGYDSGLYGYRGCVRFEDDDSSTNSNFYSTNLSKARDNEARRLEEMAYATNPERNVSDLIIDSFNKLENTWMCAETSIVGVPVATSQKGFITETETETIPNFEESNVNFGLILRPQTSYTLEKHITKLKVDGIADVEVAKDESGNYIFENGLLGYTDSIGGLSLATATTKDTGIGMWTVQTDTDNIRGGISITYGYKITKSGEGEYIGKALQEALNNGTTYKTLASTLKEEQKNPFTEYILGTYLGTAYYLGEIGTDVNAGGGISSVKIEDYLSSNSKRALQIKNDTFTSVGNADKKVWLDTTNEAIEKVNVIQSKPITFGEDGTAYVELSLRKDIIDTTTEKDGLTYRSYAAQLVPAGDTEVSTTGLVTLGNLQYVQAYTTNFPVRDLVPEDDEFIAETVIITKSTGGIDPNGN